MYTDEAKRFLAFLSGKGVCLNDIPDVLGAYDSLSDRAKLAIADLLEEQQGERIPTLKNFLGHHTGPLNIVLCDREGTAHDLPPNVWTATSAEAEWLMSLPLLRVDRTGEHHAAAVLETGFSADELSFLGVSDPLLRDSCSPETSELILRAEMANAGFADRLAYLTEGIPFEISFVPDCMDVVNSSERTYFCDFLQDQTGDIFIRWDPNKDAFYAYAIIPDANPIDFDLLGIKLRNTAARKGLTSTVKGKCAWAEHRAKKARAEVMYEKSEHSMAHSAGKDFTL